MERWDTESAVFVAVVAALGLSLALLGWVRGRRRESVGSIVVFALVAAIGAYIAVVAGYVVAAGISFGGTCYAILQGARSCTLLEHLGGTAGLFAPATAPLILVWFVLALIPAFAGRLVSRGGGRNA